MISSGCLTAEDAETYTAGMLSRERAERIRKHLEQCDACKQLVEESGAHAGLLVQLRDVVEHDEVSGRLSPRDPPHGKASPGGPESDGDAPTERSLPVAMPAQIGQFHIKRVIATGGMGTVYEAVQERPRRTVAVKVMKRGVASRSALRRFGYESQILARLHHPGIAQVYEAGTHDDGSGAVPYFAMEYIPNARPITDYARLKKLGTRERLQLFVHVCEAVHHGHQKGIIHRDLKPGNILVEPHGGLKIIDFGVARATDSDMTVTTLQTEVGQLVGTLQYMSPEQCEADPHDLDTRSDVYALGVVLYELLCEKPPYDMSGITVFAAARLIREQQPTPLSTIDRALRGDVETVVLKALEKDRERRYQSADELRRDLEHYLKGEPISARPPSVAYQFRIFARRNKALVGGVAAVLLVLVAGIIVSTRLYLRAEGARAEAAHEAEMAEAINAFFSEMLASVDPVQLYTFSRFGPDEPLTRVATQRFGRDVSVEEMMRWAVPRIEENFAGKPELEATVRETIGMTFFGLGCYQDSEPQLRTAWNIRRRLFGDDHPDTLRAQFQLGNLLRGVGKEADAESLVRSALDGMRRVFGEEHPHTLTCARVLAMTLYTQEEFDGAKRIFRATREVQRRVLGPEHRDTLATTAEWAVALLFQADRYNEAEELVLSAYEVSHRTLGPHDYLTILSEMLKGRLHMTQGKYAAAEELLRSALDKSRRILGEEHPVTLLTMLSLADALRGEETLGEQEQLLREALTGLRAGLGHGHLYTYDATRLLARFLTGVDRFDEAEQLWRRNIESCGRTLEEEHVGMARALLMLGSFLLDRDKLDEGREWIRQGLELLARVFGEGHARTLNQLMHAAAVFYRMEEFEESREIAARAIAAGARWAQRPEATARDLNNYAWLLLTCDFEGLRDPHAALPLAERAVALDHGDNPDYLDTLARAYHVAGDDERAIETQRRALAALPSAESPARCDLEGDMVGLLFRTGEVEAAERFLREATTRRREKLGEKNPLLATRLMEAAASLTNEGAHRLAEPLAREALVIRRQTLPKRDWRTAQAQSVLGGCLIGLGRYQEAEPLLLEAHAALTDNPQAPCIPRREALGRMVKLYEDWGKPDDAAEWKAKLAASQPGKTENHATRSDAN